MAGSSSQIAKRLKVFFKSFIAWAQTVPEDANAIRLLGHCYRFGWGVKKDEEGAVQFYKRASELGNQGARVSLALCYINGTGVEKDTRKGVRILQECAELGNQDVRIRLALCYVNGIGVEKDARKGARILQECADNGSAFAMRNLAGLRMKGTGIIKDVSKAIALYEKAAEMGDDVSMCKLGELYEKEEKSAFGDIRRSINCDKEAFKWYKKAAEKGNEFGMIKTAVAYLRHKGTDEDDNVKSERKGYRLFLQIANTKGLFTGTAEDMIGEIHERGLAGTKEDKEKALEWYEKSAQHGCEWGVRDLERLESKLFDADTVLERRAERAKASGGEIVTDVPTLLDKAERMKNDTFVLKGFYLGMLVDEAAVLVRHYLPGANVVVTENNDIEIDVVHKEQLDVQPMFFCRADGNRKVRLFNFDKRFLGKWFKYDAQTHEEWIGLFGQEMGFRFVPRRAKGENGGITVLQECFVSRNEGKKFTLGYYGDKKVFDPHGDITLDKLAADPFKAGRIEAARQWVSNGFENNDGAREGTLRLELIK